MLTSPAIEQSFLHHGRDLRLDFLRGIVMLVVVSVHLEYFSLISMFLWETLGLFSSAEGFVTLSGVVLGIVYKKRLLKEGFKAAAIKLWRRAGRLYLVNVAMIVSILLLERVPHLNTFAITHWVHISGNPSYYLFPQAGSSLTSIIKKTLLLEIGPHQFQIIGLYTELISISPLILYALFKQKSAWVLAISWIIYLANIWLGIRLSGAKFEYGFPSLSWQLLFFNGMIIGFHHQKVFNYVSDPSRKWLTYLTGTLLLGFMLLALNNPAPFFWPWDTVFYHDKESYYNIYNTWFSKERLGFGRIVNNAALYIFLFALISRHWGSCYKLFGWLLIPIGQASLYVFIWHVYFVLLFSNTPLPGYNNIWINTGIHLASIALIWLMVKKRFLFKLVPR
ncbi:MAG: succinyl transferase OpgC [Methylococcaceae bacterium]|nr:succinyl transferase OpgC [Methylococcaceae bacterium]